MAKKKRTQVRVVSAETSRDEALAATLGEIEKAHGEGVIMRLGGQQCQRVPVIPTGSIGLDQALGVGGLPKGRVVELFGPEASGKTTMALHVVANAQAAGGVAVYIDAEHAFDPAYARLVGVNLEELLMSQPDTGEQALSVAESLVRSNAVDVVVIDSVAALVPRAEVEGEMGDTHVGLQARLMSQALRKLTGALARSKTCMIFINQIRMKIGVMYGSPETTPGGNALKFYSSVRLDIRRKTAVKDGEQVIGSLVRARVIKNKVAPPFRDATFELLFGQGVSREGELLDLGEARRVLSRKQSWYSFGEVRLGNGRERARQFLKENPDLANEIERAIRQDADADQAQEEPTAQAS